MTKDNDFAAGMMAGVLLCAAGSALHWFSTAAAHPDASQLRTVLVGAQLVIGLAGSWGLTLAARRRKALARRATPTRVA